MNRTDRARRLGSVVKARQALVAAGPEANRLDRTELVASRAHLGMGRWPDHVLIGARRPWETAGLVLMGEIISNW